ncbi:XrtA system polysaccharide chain length determinant [Alteromonas flava]|uniref:XrtA system polysaccharide chain length determinant n=1 Tax=Alteromonas flava TaxID=2048003 RepID=UPI000C293D9D|nr:XrtA system polysaccharide chain length determinant [Alteromonas flava]
MEELIKSLEAIKEYVGGIWFKKRYVIISTWLVCPALMFAVFMMQDQYESEASVYVDTSSALRPLLQGVAVQSDPDQEVAMIVRTLLSRPNIEKLARETDLDIQAKSEIEYEELIVDLMNDIKVRSRGGRREDRIYTIQYTHDNPQTAQSVVNETLDLFIEGTLGESRVGSDTANRFLDEQIAEYEARLSQSEQRLANFKRQYSYLLPVQGTFYSNLAEQREARNEVTLNIGEVTKQIEALSQRLISISSSVNFESGLDEDDNRLVKTEYDARIDSLRARLDELQLRYTDLHPDVRRASDLLTDLEEKRARKVQEYMATLKSDSSSAASSNNPFAQQLGVELSKLEAELASLEVRQQDLDRVIEDLTNKIDQVPLVEAELTALNRDYDITKSKYEELLSKRESATISRNAEISDDDIKFRVIVPPTLPTKPSGPKRILFYTGILILGFGAGFAIAFVISQISPVVLSAENLHRSTGIPVLGVVEDMNKATKLKQERIRVAFFALSCSGIFTIYAGFVLIELLNIDLISKFERFL